MKNLLSSGYAGRVKYFLPLVIMTFCLSPVNGSCQVIPDINFHYFFANEHGHHGYLKIDFPEHSSPLVGSGVELSPSSRSLLKSIANNQRLLIGQLWRKNGSSSGRLPRIIRKTEKPWRSCPWTC